ncbi:hypothetical protein LTR86_005988 [Recurvomyces mirabilis]|nr:hypothetical protein LTR86_005988 [Recurvomyces mirabilis]
MAHSHDSTTIKSAMRPRTNGDNTTGDVEMATREQATSHNEPSLSTIAVPTLQPSETVPSHIAAESTASHVSSEIAWRLYLSHFLSTWNSRCFEFGSVLFFAAIYPHTLLYLSIYAICRSAAGMILATAIGKAIDSQPRLRIVRISIVGGRLAVILSALGIWALWMYKSIPWNANMALFSGLILLSCVEKAASMMNLVAVERDWAIVIAGNNEPVLQKLNARMRRIDLICKLAGPLFIALIDGASTTVAIWLLLGLNAMCLPIEFLAIAQEQCGAKVYHRIPDLRLPKSARAHEPVSRTYQNTSHARQIRHRLISPFADAYTALIYYSHHQAFIPSLALALLYLTVLSFSGQMTTYLLSAGLSTFYIGLIRSLSVLIELSATWLAPRLMSRISPARSAMWFLNWQILWLAGTVTFFWSWDGRREIVAAWGLAVGTIMSRVGLWGYDLSAQVIIQTEVEERHRGSFSSTEAAFQNFFELLAYALTIALPQTTQFKFPVLVSGVVVLAAGVLYAYYLRSRRGHLVHIPCTTKSSDANGEA